MKPRPSRVVHLLWVSIAAALAGLAGLAVFLHYASLRIDAMDALIADDTGPTIVAIENINVHLSQIRELLREHLQSPGDVAALERRLNAEREDLKRSVARYLGLPVDPGEQEVQDEMRRHLASFDGLVTRILAVKPASPVREREGLRAELDATATALDQVLVLGSNLNANLAYEAAADLRGVRSRILPGALALELVSTVAAIVAIGAAYRMSRHEVEYAETRALQLKNAELEAFSARVAHDLLSPLSVVSMALGLTEQRLSVLGEERHRDMVARAGRSLQRVRQMVEDLLSFARSAAMPPRGAQTEVGPLLSNVVGDLQPLASEAGVELRLESASARSVPCAEGILSSMMSNLVQNAIRHAGKLRGSASDPEASSRVGVRALDDGPEVRFEVEDTGPGVRSEDRESIFEPYVSNSQGGSGLGLGLATVKRLAQAHGGRVGVDSAAGHGATFWVALPAVTAAAAAPAGRSPHA
jgi:signal transduction histidine kinase